MVFVMFQKSTKKSNTRIGKCWDQIFTVVLWKEDNKKREKCQYGSRWENSVLASTLIPAMLKKH